MLLDLANRVMQNRKNAILIAMLFSIVPLMGWVADIIMALVTLRQGAKEGALILMWIMLPSLVLALTGHPQFLFYNVLAGSVLTYIFALILRSTAVWSTVLLAAVVIGIVEIAGIHLVLPNLGTDWSTNLLGYFETLRQELALQTTNNSMLQWATFISKIVTGIQVTFLFLYNLIILLLARIVQAKLYNPAGLRPELYNVRNHWLTIVILIGIIAAAAAGNDIAIDCVFLILMPFIIAGLSLSHCLAAMVKLNSIWFIGFYGLVILFFPYCALTLVAFALLDSWFNFRERFKIRYQK